MKKKACFAVLCALCITMALYAGAQQGSSVPKHVCEGIEKFVAATNTAGATRDKTARQKQYSDALDSLTVVVNGYGGENLLQQARELAEYTELMAATDPTDSRFSEFIAKRLKSANNLQSICIPYTTSR
jgi:hypothetical protein